MSVPPCLGRCRRLPGETRNDHNDQNDLNDNEQAANLRDFPKLARHSCLARALAKQLKVENGGEKRRSFE
jgi:hypothetical protein